MISFWILSAFLTAVCIGLIWRDLACVKKNRRFSYIIACIIPLCAVGLYTQLGTPSMPDMPSVTEKKSIEQVLLKERPLLKQLRQDPKSTQSWLDLSQVYLDAGRIENAVNSLREAVDKKQTPRLKVKLSELLKKYPHLAKHPQESLELLQGLD